ncbi:eCIS core domain-containing protein [Echinicola shivajiensis]|uniref:eCIS core domain-containing protein n=1 Tax=Echinicola shivajiensis TaxID=1035916 RepID=UPI001BFC07A0|nr:DUF4157 domain-containing protein [Echinicola shivajiensis]
MRELKKRNKRGQSNEGLINRMEDGQKDFFGVQAKLEMGKPGDKYEQEADAVANQVVNNTAAKKDHIQQKGSEEELQQKPLASSISMVQKQDLKEEQEPVQSKSAEAEPEEPLQKAEDEEVQAQEEEEAMQTKSEEEEAVQSQEEEEVAQTKSETPSARQQGAHHIEASLNQSKGSGRKMDAGIKNEMETGFGADFSHVRIHTDERANHMSKAIGAQAFTHGNDIYFNSGKYSPESHKGKELLAHELTHTVQQKGMVQKKVQRNWSKNENYKSYDGKTIKADLKLKFEGAVLNKSSNASLNAAGLASAAKSQIENSYKGKLRKSIFGIDVVYDVSTTANVRVINKLTDLNFMSEHLIVVLDDSHPKVNGTYGRGPFYGTIVYLNEKHTPGMISGSDKNTIPHEVGHTAGLKHLMEKSDESGMIGKLIKELHHHQNKDNMMWRGGGHPSYSMADADQKLVKTNPDQLDKVRKHLNNNELNKVNVFNFIDLMKLGN